MFRHFNKVTNVLAHEDLGTDKIEMLLSTNFNFNIVRAGPSRCGTQCKTWARGPTQDLGAGPLWVVIAWRHRVHSTV